MSGSAVFWSASYHVMGGIIEQPQNSQARISNEKKPYGKTQRSHFGGVMTQIKERSK